MYDKKDVVLEIPAGYKVRYVKGRGPARIRGKTILMPEWYSKKEKQESLAHEIAHIELGHKSGKEGELSIYDFLPIEIEAQKLGRRLLGRRGRLPPGDIAKIIENVTIFINGKYRHKTRVITVAEIFLQEADRLGLPSVDIEKAIGILVKGEVVEATVAKKQTKYAVSGKKGKKSTSVASLGGIR